MMLITAAKSSVSRLNLDLVPSAPSESSNLASKLKVMGSLAAVPEHEALLQHLVLNLLRGKASMAQALPLLRTDSAPFMAPSSSLVLQQPSVKRFRSVLVDAVKTAEELSNPDNRHVFAAIHNVSNEITEFFAYAPYMKLPSGEGDRAVTLATLKELVTSIREVIHYRKQLLLLDKRQRAGNETFQQESDSVKRSRKNATDSSELSGAAKPRVDCGAEWVPAVKTFDAPLDPELEEEEEDELVMDMMLEQGVEKDDDDEDPIESTADDDENSDSDVEADPRFLDLGFGMGQADPLYC
jgi:hypothetical protein